jgi:hypothetical protein
MGKVQERVLMEARYMSTFVVGYLDPTEDSQGDKYDTTPRKYGKWQHRGTTIGCKRLITYHEKVFAILS